MTETVDVLAAAESDEALAEVLQLSAAGKVTDQDLDRRWRVLRFADQEQALQAPRPAPTLLTRTDGAALLYRGKINAINGESEAGKSWAAAVAAVEVLAAGESVLWLDFDSDEHETLSRLRALGADRRRLVYVPGDGFDRLTYLELLSEKFALCVIDTLTQAHVAFDSKADGNSNDSVTRFMRFPKQIANATGAGVLLLDHVNKNSDSRGRYATGSLAKLAAVSGSVLVAEVIDQIRPGHVGRLALKVAKDRSGGVRKYAAAPGAHGLQEAGVLTIDATGAAAPLELRGYLAPPRDATDRQTAVLGKHLQRLSEHLQLTAQPLSTYAQIAKVAGCSATPAKVLDVLEAGRAQALFHFEFAGAKGNTPVITPLITSPSS